VEQASQLSSLLQESSAKIGVPLQTDQVQAFMVYLHQLQSWNQSFNLTSITLGEEIIIKHFVDSLAALKADDVDVSAKLLDVGTGAGFPGIPLKIARPNMTVVLVEPVRKKSSFLRFIVGLLRLQNVDIYEGTFEKFVDTYQTDRLFDYITTRAMKPDVILGKGARLLRQGGKAILYSSQVIHRSGVCGNWRVLNEYAFDLPGGHGRRVVSIFLPLS
jgi:16S rRNA (guanine527-N7)-methyltransferase